MDENLPMINRYLPPLLFALIINGCGSDQESTNSDAVLRPVKTLTVGEHIGGFTREFPGVVDAVRKADLAFRVAGKLQSMHVHEGDVVELGQVLAELDKTDYQIQLQSSQANYEQARGDFQRAQELVKKGYLSSSDYDALKAKQSTAKASLDTARQNLTYTTLYAPFSGRVAKRHQENFEDIAAGQPIFTLYDLSAYTVKVDLPESFIVNITSDTDIPPTIFATFDTIPGKQFPLKFKEVATQPDPSTKTYQVSLIMAPDSNYNILPGMSVRVTGKSPLPTRGQSTGIFVPAVAVQEDAEGRFVYLAKPTTGDGRMAKVHRAEVSTGRLTEFGVEIISGLSADDRVIVAGVSKMRDGLDVKLMGE